jgi:hypothetical protein
VAEKPLDIFNGWPSNTPPIVGPGDGQLGWLPPGSASVKKFGLNAATSGMSGERKVPSDGDDIGTPMSEPWGIMPPTPSKGLVAGKPPLGARPEGGGDKGAKPFPPSNPNLGGTVGVEAAAVAEAAAAAAAAYIAFC